MLKFSWTDVDVHSTKDTAVTANAYITAISK
jgi:hypothetical protein